LKMAADMAEPLAYLSGMGPGSFTIEVTPG
jgi:hypothetical protein